MDEVKSSSTCRSTDVDQALFIEPFYGGSHKQLMDLLVLEFAGELYTLPATKWHWRMRTSALYFSMVIPHNDSYRSLFASSVLNLCELVSLRPDLAKLHKILYFHENQLVYPVRKHQDRDFQYGYNEILSCLVADAILFNSHFNMNSFLNSIDSFLKLIPDHRPKGVSDKIRAKCSVLYFPLELHNCNPVVASTVPSTVVEADRQDSKPKISSVESDSPVIQGVDVLCRQENEGSVGVRACEKCNTRSRESARGSNVSIVNDSSPTDSESTAIAQTVASKSCPLHIIWPHRWEHDKGPVEFSTVLIKLLNEGLNFTVSVLGAHTNDIPASFSKLFPLLGPRLVNKGHMPKSVYWDVLKSADVVVSTANHEFFGVAMLEAVVSGCYPLCPNRLVYPEFYPEECLYNTEQQLFKRLKEFCRYPHLARGAKILEKMRVIELFKWENLKMNYSEHLY